jgi:hypothetical protein
MKRRKLFILAGALGVVIVGSLTTVAVIDREPGLPPVDAPNKVLVKFCATDQFAKLRLDQQEPYVARLMDQGFLAIFNAANEANMSPEERQKGLENSMQAGMNVRWGRNLNEWLKLDEKAKAEYVQQVIAEMPPRPPGFDPRGASRNTRFMTPEQQKRFIEGMSPNRRAAMAEFMQQLQQARGDGGQ